MGHSPITTPRARFGAPPDTDPLASPEDATDASWSIALAAARQAEQVGQTNKVAAFAIAPAVGTTDITDIELRPVPVGHPDAVLAPRQQDRGRVRPGRDPVPAVRLPARDRGRYPAHVRLEPAA